MTAASQPSLGRVAALSLMGVGLLGIGIVILLLGRSVYAPASPGEFSAIPVEVNFSAPDLNLVNLEGAPVSLGDYKGSVVLVNLWATWCPPCREEMPTLQAFYEKYKVLGFVLIAVDQGETVGQVRPFVEEYRLTFPIWMDYASQAGRAFNTISLPSSYVIDRNGRVRLMWYGGISAKNLDLYVPAVIFE